MKKYFSQLFLLTICLVITSCSSSVKHTSYTNTSASAKETKTIMVAPKQFRVLCEIIKIQKNTTTTCEVKVLQVKGVGAGSISVGENNNMTLFFTPEFQSLYEKEQVNLNSILKKRQTIDITVDGTPNLTQRKVVALHVK